LTPAALSRSGIISPDRPARPLLMRTAWLSSVNGEYCRSGSKSRDIPIQQMWNGVGLNANEFLVSGHACPACRGMRFQYLLYKKDLGLGRRESPRYQFEQV